MAGWGRNVKQLKICKPKSITLVDINADNIDKAKEEFKNNPLVKPYCSDLNKWIKQDDS